MKTILPKNKKNPNNVGRLFRRSSADTKKRFKSITKSIIDLISEIPSQKINADTGNVVNSKLFSINENRYEYLVDALQLRLINEQMMLIIDEGLHDDFNRWYLQDYVIDSYAQGTAESVVNLQSIGGDEYNRTIDQVLSSQAYRDRLAFVTSRIFEDMQGFTENMRVDLARTLGDAMAAGDNPRNVAKKIRKRIGVNHSRAIRIARTEINQAHRRARWDESESASQQMGIKTRLMHISALIPGRTRASHAARHGHVFTRKEVEDWYQVDGNAINCLCTQVEVLVDKNGVPVDKSLVKRTTEEGKVFFAQFGTANRSTKKAA